MKKGGFLYLLAVLFLASCCGDTASIIPISASLDVGGNQLTDDIRQNYEVLIQKVQLTITNQNEVLGKMSYELPFLVFNGGDDPCGLEKINFVLRDRCSQFFKEDYSYFLQRVSEKNASSAQYVNAISSQIAYQDENFLSIHQIQEWYTGGVISFSDFGMTFNLKSGALLSLEDFIDSSFHDFQECLLDYLYAESGKTSQMFQMFDDWRSIYRKSGFEDYEYYYSDGMLYIIEESFITSEASKIVLWSIQDQAPVGIISGTASNAA